MSTAERFELTPHPEPEPDEDNLPPKPTPGGISPKVRSKKAKGKKS